MNDVVHDDPAVAGAPLKTAKILVAMGVSGSGKSSLGEALAARLGWVYMEGDDLHPHSNIAKMSAGMPLTDEDRWPWLDAVSAWIAAQLRKGRGGVISCSALKRVYRDRLRQAGAGICFVYLEVDPAELARRMKARRHFMPPSLLDSQLAALQEPAADELAVTVPALDGIETTVDAALRALKPYLAVTPR